jgi:hypothetical protein
MKRELFVLSKHLEITTEKHNSYLAKEANGDDQRFVDERQGHNNKAPMISWEPADSQVVKSRPKEISGVKCERR